MSYSNYKGLKVGQKAMDMAEETYKLVKFLPKEELYALSDQIRRAVVSIPSNIAEGNGRNSKAEFVHFLSIAQGSRAEVETQLQLCVCIGYLTENQITKVMSISSEVGKMLTTLITKYRV